MKGHLKLIYSVFLVMGVAIILFQFFLEVKDQQTGVTTIFPSGNHSVNKDIYIPRGSTLSIEPGTTLRIAKDIKIVVSGKIIADGTKEEPIIFTALSSQPWGALLLLDDRSGESILNHMIIEKGSNAKYRRVTYNGQLSVYNSNLKMRNSILRDNKGEQDNFNAVNSNVEIINSIFNDSLGDAVDFDYTNGTIKGSWFMNSHDDAIDLMESNPIIEGNLIIGSGDKGISIGENSNPLVSNNKITKCNIGIAIKDTSDPIINNTQITANKIGIDSHHKTPGYYDYGGRGRLFNSVVCKNENNFNMDKTSSLRIYTSDTDFLVCNVSGCVEELCR